MLAYKHLLILESRALRAGIPRNGTSHSRNWESAERYVNTYPPSGLSYQGLRNVPKYMGTRTERINPNWHMKLILRGEGPEPLWRRLKKLTARAVKPAGGLCVGDSSRRWPVAFHRGYYRRRHKVENFFCRLKRYRRLSSRYEKLALTFLAFVQLAAVVDWLIH